MRWLAAVGLLSGIALAVLFVANREAPMRSQVRTEASVLTVIEVRPLPFRLEARGHGISRPAETWKAVANVSGRVVERHPELESGTLLPEGTLLLALDPARYALAIDEAESQLALLSAEQAQLDTEKENTLGLLSIERERLALSEQELARIERLAASNNVSRSRRDEQRRATLAQRQGVKALENELALFPAREQRLRAEVDRAATRLKQARQDLADTRFVAPYDLRVSEVDVELHQHVGVGQRLFQADSIEAAEVEAFIPLGMLRRLMEAVPPSEQREVALDIRQWLDFSAIQTEVYLVGIEDVQWQGRVTRIASGLDPRTRAVRVVVTVDEPYRLTQVPERPALQREMYVRVHLSVDSPEPVLAVPTSAVHDGEVYLVDKDSRLARQPVSVQFEQNDLAVIVEGLSPGDQVIVDDPGLAIDGMAVSPRRDEALERRLAGRALGRMP